MAKVWITFQVENQELRQLATKAARERGSTLSKELRKVVDRLAQSKLNPNSKGNRNGNHTK